MIFIDSDCIIDFLKGKKEAMNVVEKFSEELATSQINVFEVFHGIFRQKSIKDNEVNSADNFFKSISIFSFDERCGKISAKIFSNLFKQGKMIHQNDCFIGTIMLKNGCNSIITKNKKHFSRIQGIKVVSY